MDQRSDPFEYHLQQARTFHARSRNTLNEAAQADFFKQALEHYQQAAQLAGHFHERADLLCEWGNCLLESCGDQIEAQDRQTQTRLELACEHFARASGLEEENLDAWLGWARAYTRQICCEGVFDGKKIEQLHAKFQRMFSLQPENCLPYLEYGISLTLCSFLLPDAEKLYPYAERYIEQGRVRTKNAQEMIDALLVILKCQVYLVEHLAEYAAPAEYQQRFEQMVRMMECIADNWIQHPKLALTASRRTLHFANRHYRPHNREEGQKCLLLAERWIKASMQNQPQEDTRNHLCLAEVLMAQAALHFRAANFDAGLSAQTAANQTFLKVLSRCKSREELVRVLKTWDQRSALAGAQFLFHTTDEATRGSDLFNANLNHFIQDALPLPEISEDDFDSALSLQNLLFRLMRLDPEHPAEIPDSAMVYLGIDEWVQELLEAAAQDSAQAVMLKARGKALEREVLTVVMRIQQKVFLSHLPEDGLTRH